MLLLETDDVPPADRIELYHTVATGAAGASSVEHEPGERFRKRVETWTFGPVVLFATSGSGMRYWQTARHLRMDSRNTVSVITQPVGRGGFIWNDHQRAVTSDDLVLTSKSAGYWETRWSGTGTSVAFMVDVEQLELPERVIHNAVPLIGRSPITPLLLSHLRALHHDADRLVDTVGAQDIGGSTLALTRALVASLAQGPQQRTVAEETLLIRVLAYVRAHLRDPGLTPAKVAAVHNVSVRSLYRVCEEGGVSLEQWIIRRRLEAARRELVAPEHAHRTIDAIARSWGFASPSHFGRRFRAAYGTTPRAWRAGGGTPARTVN
ncbi:helix-turn-helix domain-containing protein [Embleya sp. NPDC055664]